MSQNYLQHGFVLEWAVNGDSLSLGENGLDHTGETQTGNNRFWHEFPSGFFPVSKVASVTWCNAWLSAYGTKKKVIKCFWKTSLAWVIDHYLSNFVLFYFIFKIEKNAGFIRNYTSSFLWNRLFTCLVHVPLFTFYTRPKASLKRPPINQSQTIKNEYLTY